MTPFTPSREDGRSDRQVIYDLVSQAEPETLFEYDELISALEEGVERTITTRTVYQAVAAANKNLLREHRRYLSVVAGRGYRVLRADEHLPVALNKKATAESYLNKGIELLKNARLDELTQAQRTLHEGQLMILSGVYQAVKVSAARHDQQERVIDELREQQRQIAERLTKIEGESS